MTKRKTKKQAQKLYQNLVALALTSQPDHSQPNIKRGLGINTSLTTIETPQERPKMKKFRFQLLHEWLIQQFAPCRVADIGGGKGLLAYLLQDSGWQATVIDPVNQALPDKYKDLTADNRVRIASTEQVPRIEAEFALEMARQFDLIIGMHAHGCNVKIIDAAKTFNRSFVLLPCCIIDEPIYPRLGVHWLECLVDYAIKQGLAVHPFQLNFRGQNIGFYSAPQP